MNPSWIQNYYAIEDMRRIHKFHPKEINFLFESFGEFIYKSSLSNKTKIQKNTLYFLEEIVELKSQSGIKNLILQKLPQILMKM